MSAQYRSPRSAGELAAQVERAIRSGELRPGDQLAPIRSLAAEFGLATGTVAAAYRQLRERGFVVGERRRGTVVAPVLAAPARVALGVPPDAVDLAGGNPDVELLPPLAPVLSRLGAAGHRYGEPTVLPQLAALAGTRLAEIVGDASSLAVVGGALDGIERCLQANLRAGDAVAVEDPGFTSVFDLLA